MMKESDGEPLAMMVSASCFELSMGSKRAKAICAAIRNTAEVSATLKVAARCLSRVRNTHPIAGPTSNATAASAAGRRNAANDGPVRSKKCDMESVYPATSRWASRVPMSETKGKLRDCHKPQASAAAITTPATEQTAWATLSHFCE